MHVCLSFLGLVFFVFMFTHFFWVIAFEAAVPAAYPGRAHFGCFHEEFWDVFPTDSSWNIERLENKRSYYIFLWGLNIL